MAVHPKIGFLGGMLLAAVVLGLILFLLGRETADVHLGSILGAVAAGIIVLLSLAYTLIRLLPTSRRFDGVLHQGTQPAAAGYISAQARLDLVGRRGVALSELRPVGVADIAGERVDATTEGEWLPAGTPVTVVKAEPMRLVVRRAPAQDS